MAFYKNDLLLIFYYNALSHQLVLNRALQINYSFIPAQVFTCCYLKAKRKKIPIKLTGCKKPKDPIRLRVFADAVHACLMTPDDAHFNFLCERQNSICCCWKL